MKKVPWHLSLEGLFFESWKHEMLRRIQALEQHIQTQADRINYLDNKINKEQEAFAVYLERVSREETDSDYFPGAKDGC